jgi:hypothetical protein
MIAAAKQDFIKLQAPLLPFVYGSGTALCRTAHRARLMEFST